MKRVLITWIGRTDLRAPLESSAIGLGPIAQALTTRQFDEVFLLSDYPESDARLFVQWLGTRTEAQLNLKLEKLSGPTSFSEIYAAAVRGCERALRNRVHEVSLVFHLSPGTPAMAAIWILLGKTRFPAELIESSREHGVQTVTIPFDIAADFLPDMLRSRDEQLREASSAKSPTAPEFDDIVHRSRTMERLIQRARKVAVRNVPVLIEGESGTGKEMLARAIHRSSLRQDQPFVAVNCGAIPGELIESELFGHEKGSFTGAAQLRRGHFESASGGTLFLDEIGELPGPAQVKMLRTLQEGEVVRVGASKPLKVDVRIVAATNRSLIEEIGAGRFREDLFYRLAVAVLTIPPLRDRAGDVGLLIDHLLRQVNREAMAEAGHKERKLSAAARNILLSHTWPGNVRELLNTIRRTVIWTDGQTISAEDAREALLPAISGRRQDTLERPLGDGLDLPKILKDVARHYLNRAMDEAHNNKTRAAELLGLSSYQTLTNWLNRYDVHK